MKKKVVKGLIVSCTKSGVISEVVRNDFFKKPRDIIGRHFPTLFVAEDLNKALNLIRLIEEMSFAYDTYLQLKLPTSQVRLYFMGVKLEDQILFIGSDNHKEALLFVEELQKINNEQANTIRLLIKEKVVTSESRNEDETQKLFNEITRVNNELVNLQRELNRKNAELERLNDLKNKFLGMAAHDMRNPLGVIFSYAEYLREETGENLNESQRWMLEVIQQSANFMLGLIDDLLDISKIESGKLELNKSIIDLTQNLEHWVKINSALAERKAIQLQLFTINEEVLVEVDIRKLEQVFNNLVSNAIKFSNPGSNIRITLSTTHDNVILSVKDQGVGMTAEQMALLFKPFSRIASEGTAGEKCTGLGLSIVKRIVEGHNGLIEVSSEPGMGSEFKVILPRTYRT